MTAGGVQIGVDVGTTLIKAVAFDDAGKEMAQAAVPARLERAGDGRYEQDPTEVFAAVEAVLARLAADPVVAGHGPVTAVGVTGQGDGLWLADADGDPVRPAVSWLDGRAGEVLDRWAADGTLDQVYRRTGSRLFPGSSGPILAALAASEPDVLDRAATAAYCKDLVVQRLTGLRATEASDASVPFLDPATGDYADDLIAACGLSRWRRLLAPVRPAPMAGLRPEAAARTGLPAGTPVVAAPYDLPACAWAAGVTEVGDGLLIVGTTLAAQVVVDAVPTGGEPAGLTLATWFPGRWLRAMPAMVGTAGLDWTLRLVGAAVADLPGLLAGSPPGANGVRVLPYFGEAGERAPFVESRARARFDRLHLGSTRADLVRAACEALAYAARHCLAAAGLTGGLAVCGGGAASGPWLQIFADVLGRPVRALSGEQVGARGAALAARHALGLDGWPPPAGTVWRPGVDAGGYAGRYEEYLRAVGRARVEWCGGA